MAFPYFPNCSLTFDAFDYILLFLNILDLSLLMQAFQPLPYVSLHIRKHARHRTRAIFTRLGDVNVVTSLISRLQMVVSGSRALAVAQPSVAEFVWNSDVDLYAPFGKVSEFDEYMRGQRFTAVRRHPAVNGFDEEGYEVHRSGIHSVTTYTKGRIIIDVVESIDASPLTPIFSFHSTAVSPSIYCIRPY